MDNGPTNINSMALREILANAVLPHLWMARVGRVSLHLRIHFAIHPVVIDKRSTTPEERAGTKQAELGEGKPARDGEGDRGLGKRLC